MGKRTLHTGVTFYQCDWTGLPLHQVNAYMPAWNDKGQLWKRGSYCNWESVMAHAAAKYAKEEFTLEQYREVEQHVYNVVGAKVQMAPHYLKLEHLGGSMSATEYEAECQKRTSSFVAIYLPCNNLEPYEVKIDPWCELFLGTEDYKEHFIATMDVKTDRELYMHCSSTQEPNHAATLLLDKQPVTGPAIVFLRSKHRYLDLTLGAFNEYRTMKKQTLKRSAPATTEMSVEDYNSMKQDMQLALNKVEEFYSRDAVAPNKMRRGAKVVPTGGAELAEALKERGTHPPLPSRQLAVVGAH